MTKPEFTQSIGDQFDNAELLVLKPEDKVLIISDFHMANGKRADDFNRNGDLVMDILEQYYLPANWYLVLNGDIEELQRYSLHAIQKQWKRMYTIFDAFARKGRLYKTLGNHDEELVFEKNYPYKVLDSVRIETGVLPVHIYHGHQASSIYTRYNNMIRAALRYIVKPVGIKNISSARSPRRRFHVERRAYEYSRSKNIVSVIGHTHRPLFESLGRFDYIKFEIERLCRDYPFALGKEKEKIAREVKALQSELGKLKRSERRRSLHESLYGDELPVPCLFNSGSVIGKKGIYAIELDTVSISLIYWFSKGEGKKFISRGHYTIEKLAGTNRRKTVLNKDNLEYIKARMELLR